MKKQLRTGTVGYKSELCHTCGQKVDPIIYKKRLIKSLKKQGFPSLAKLLFKLT